LGETNFLVMMTASKEICSLCKKRKRNAFGIQP
jgi:hypothetical protein